MPLADVPAAGRISSDDRGFTMVVLLVVMAVMAVGMTAMLPTWNQQAIREKEEELIFRGNQYARALVLYSRKNNNLLPTNIDLLYEGKYLRRKWKDPITGEDFGLLPAALPAAPGRGQAVGPGRGTAGGGTQPTPPAPQPQAPRGTGPGASAGQQIVGSIQGVYSTSTDTSIRVYQNQQRYIDWQFTVQTAMALMGGARGGAAGMPGVGGQDGRGNQGRGDGGRGGAQGLPGRGIGPGVGRPGGRGVQPGPPGQPGQAGRGGGTPVIGGRGRGS